MIEFDVPDDTFVGKAYDPKRADRGWEEVMKEREAVMKKSCPSCGRKLQNHSAKALKSCATAFRKKKFGK